MEQIKVLRDGFWERTTVVRAASGELSVRKEATAAGADSPWGLTALRQEIRFLTSLPDNARQYYPHVLEQWDDDTTGSVGYRIPFYDDYRDVSAWLREGSLPQEDADAIQMILAEAVLNATHKPSAPGGIVAHIKETIETAIARLRALPEFVTCIDAPNITLNGRTVPGLGMAYALACSSEAMATLAALPAVRLHGDLILENILWNPMGNPRLRLIDPVSVAGIWHGPAVFDLVKYCSYATGELFALRSGLIHAGPAPHGTDAFVYKAPVIPAFTRIDLLSRFTHAFRQRHGPEDRGVEQLLDGYFSLVMAVNTHGIQQWGRILKGILSLNAAANQ